MVLFSAFSVPFRRPSLKDGQSSSIFINRFSRGWILENWLFKTGQRISFWSSFFQNKSPQLQGDTYGFKVGLRNSRMSLNGSRVSLHCSRLTSLFRCETSWLQGEYLRFRDSLRGSWRSHYGSRLNLNSSWVDLHGFKDETLRTQG
jgi:hypothetical protein